MKTGGEARGRWIIGITGASGARYGLRLCEQLMINNYGVDLLVTDAGWRVLKEEEGWNWDHTSRLQTLQHYFGDHQHKLHVYPIRDIGAAIASGTHSVQGMCIIPCSMGTLASIAHGLSDNLLERAADVMIKEKRPLILVPRETPLSEIHLTNMLTLARTGVTILPAMPAFYHHPKTISDIVDFITGKVMDAMGIRHQLFKRWGEADDSITNSNRGN